MRPIALVLAATLIGGPASAQEADAGWTVVGLEGGEAFGWSALSVTKNADGSTATLKTFNYSSTGHGIAPGSQRFHYQVEDIAFRCGAAKYTPAKTTLMDIEANVLGVATSNQGFSVRPNTLVALLEGIACRGVVVAGMNDLPVVRDAEITGVRNFDSIEEAMAGARSMAVP